MVKLGTLITPAETVRCGKGNYPVLSMTMRDGLVFQDAKFKKVIASKDTSDYKVVFRNQLVISFPIDEGVLASQRIADAGIVSPAYGIWDIKQDQILPEFLEYALRCPRAISYYKGKLRGSTARRRSLPTPTLLEFLIPLPSLEEQNADLEIIHKAKEIIELRKEELSSLDDLIKARFVEMFGHQSQNEKGLPYKTVDDVAEIYLGITHTPEYVDDGVIFISAKNTSGDFLDLTDVKHISREEFEGAPTGAKPRKNDVLFSRVGSNLGHPVILEEDIELCTFVSLGFLRTKGMVTSNYLKHWMRDGFFPVQVSEHVKGGGQPNLNTGWLKQFRIIVPDLLEQREFDDFCLQVNKSKAVVQKALDEAQLLFDSLMQLYFN